MEKRKNELSQKLSEITGEIAQLKELLSKDSQSGATSEISNEVDLLLQQFSRIEEQLAQLALALSENPSPERSAELAETAGIIVRSISSLKNKLKEHLSTGENVSGESKEDLISQRKISLATSEMKMENFSKEMQEIEAEISQIVENQAKHQEQISECGNKKQVISTQIREMEEKSRALNDQLSQSRANVAESLETLIQKREDMERQLEELEKGLSQATLDEQRKMSELSRIEVNLAKLEAEVAGVKERLKEDYNMGEEEVLQTAYAPRGGQVKSEIGELRIQITNLGLVNPLAIEEHQKGTERLAFMDKQVTDLNASQDNLKTLIVDLDNLARENFIKIVDAVSIEFSKIFASLFAGGEAKITLTDPQNVLETGVEIYAKPGGKKLLNLSSLSGGEKALTAISLLFALLRVHPSPFCFLDEVDAALDDANVNRFTQMLKDFSKKVQIIVVTHSKQTMAAADVIYGVTMEEAGVSKIVSMKMAEASAAAA